MENVWHGAWYIGSAKSSESPLDYKSKLMIPSVTPEGTVVGVHCQLPIRKNWKWIISEMIMYNVSEMIMYNVQTIRLEWTNLGLPSLSGESFYGIRCVTLA